MLKVNDRVAPAQMERTQSRPSFGRVNLQGKDDSLKQQSLSVSESNPTSASV